MQQWAVSSGQLKNHAEPPPKVWLLLPTAHCLLLTFMSQSKTETERVATGVGKKILDVGCGSNKHPGAIGIDFNPRTDADVIHDLGVVPYPFDDNEFDAIISRHVIEHVPDVMAFISELHRITKPGGRIKLVTPHYTN